MVPSSSKLFYLLFSFLILEIFNIKIHTQNNPTVTYDSLKSILGQKIDYKYYDNLNAPNTNYYYGAITKQSYQMRIKLYKMDNYQQCSLITSFATKDMQSCISCPIDRPLFNLGTRQCEICKPHLTQKCDAIFNLNTPALSNNNSSTISNTPSITSNTSIVSAPPNISSVNNTSKINTNTQPSTSPKTQTPTTRSTSATQTKPLNTQQSPYIVIWQPNRENITKKSNQSLTTTSNTTTISNQNFILQPVPVGKNGIITPHQNYTYIDYRVVDDSKAQNQTNQTSNANLIAKSVGDNSTFATKQCPPNQPYFNLITKSCQACKTAQQYVSFQKKCLPLVYISNFKYRNIILEKPDQLLSANNQISKAYPERTVVLCPIDQPIAVKNTCRGCSSQLQLFNFTNSTCQQSCPEGLIFSPTNSKCITATYLTNSDAPHLLSPLKDFDGWRNSQKQKVKSASTIVECPITKPIMIGGKCTTCPSDKPLFNIQSQQCQGCSRNREYSQVQRKCVSRFNTGLQVKKMIPNIF